VESSSVTVASREATTPGAPAVEPQPELKPPPATAQRFVAFYFDDIVTSFEDLVRTRDAAGRYLQSSLQPTDRAGIFTSSGLGDLDFTDDRDKLREALARLKPHPTVVRPELDCPPLSAYEAYLIVETRDQQSSKSPPSKLSNAAAAVTPPTARTHSSRLSRERWSPGTIMRCSPGSPCACSQAW
jgi:hypothetical protein